MTNTSLQQLTAVELATPWLLLATVENLHYKHFQIPILPKWAKKENEHEPNSETGPLYIRSRNCNLCCGLHVDGKKSRLCNPTRPSELEKTQRIAELPQRAHWLAPKINPKPLSSTHKSRTARISPKRRSSHSFGFFITQIEK